MSRLTNGESIPQVGIQGYASPIQTNTVVANTGTVLQGNTLQQLAQSLAAFNPQVAAFGQAIVNRQNQQDTETAAAFNTDKLLQDERNLKRSWREVVASTGLPEAANPFFQVELARNMGRRLAQRTWLKVNTAKERLTDPLGNYTIDQAFQEALGEDGAAFLGGNYYANLGFSEASNRLRDRTEASIEEGRLFRMETQAEMGFAESFSETLVGVATGELTESDAQALLGQQFDALQTVFSDPSKVEKTFVTAAGAALNQLPSERAVRDAVTSIGRMKYGTALVNKNIPLMAKLDEEARRAERAIAARRDSQDRELDDKTKDAERQLLRDDVVSRIATAVVQGKDMLETLQAVVQPIREDPQYGPEVAEALVMTFNRYASALQGTLTARAVPDNDAAIINIMDRIYRGEFGSGVDVLNAARESGLRRVESYTMLMKDYEAQQTSVTRAAAGAMGDPDKITYDLQEFANGNRVFVSEDERNEWANGLRDDLNRIKIDFLRGNLTDQNGRSINQIRSEDGESGVQLALSQILLDAQRKFREDKLKEVQARVQAMQSGSPSGTGAAEAKQMFMTDWTDLSSADAEVRKQGESRIRDAVLATTSEVSRSVFNQTPFGTESSMLFGLWSTGYVRTANPQQQFDAMSAMLAMEPGQEIEIGYYFGENNKSKKVVGRTVSLNAAGDTYTITTSTKASPEVTERGTWPGPPYPVPWVDPIQKSQKTVRFDDLRNYLSSYRSLPMVAIGLDNVLQGKSGDPRIPLRQIVDKTGAFPWGSQLIFRNRDEFSTYLNDESVQAQVHRQLGVGSSEEVIKTFRTAQEYHLRTMESFYKAYE